MDKFSELKVFSVKVDTNFQIVGSNQKIINYFRPEEAKAFITYLYNLKADIAVFSTKIFLNNKLYPVVVEGYRTGGVCCLDFYDEAFFFNNSQLLSSEMRANQLTAVFNVNTNKLVYVKTLGEFLVMNNIAKLNKKTLSLLSVSKPEMQKLTTAFNNVAKNNHKKDTTIIKLSIYGNEHYYKLDFSSKVVNGRSYLVMIATIADDIVIYQNKVRYYTRDSLTGLLDYKGIQDSTKYLIDTEELENFAMVALELQLEEINNMYGQLFVDQIIKLISTSMVNVYKDEFCLSRITNYRFILILKNLDNEQSIRETLRFLDLNFNELTYRGNPINLKYKVGAAIYSKDGNDFEQLYIKATKALIHSKFHDNISFTIYNDKHHAKYNILNENKNIKKNNKKNYDALLRKTIDSLLNAKNINKTIEEILNRILDIYELDRIALFTDIESSSFSFICATKEEFKTEYKMINIDYLNKFSKDFDSDNVAAVGDIETIKYISKERYEYLLATGTKSEVIINLKNENIARGYFVLHTCNDQHNFTSEEKMNFSIIAKLITSTLVNFENEKYMESIAYTDAVTGSWNLNKLKEEVSERNLSEYTVLSMDIHRFNIINSSFGYDAGDKFLHSISDFLVSQLEEGELFCRVVDDKFLYLTNCWDKNLIIAKHKKIALFIQQYLRSNYGISLDLRTGVYFKKADDTFSESIDKANRALGAVTDYLNDKIYFYTFSISKEEENEKFIESHIDEAFEKKQFIIYLQPCIDLRKGKLYGAEALVRWKLGDKIIYPNFFIPLLEKSHKIIELDFAVYEQVFRYVRFLMNNNVPLFPISMNVSRCHLLSENFIPRLLKLVKEYQIDPTYISLEITESAFVSGIEDLKKFILDLKKCGFRIYVDDFGIAYSNISLLGQIPADVLKIDKCFIDHDINNREYVILANIANMARQLGMKVLCEGVEGPKELSICKSLKFDYAQGYHYDKPLPLDDFNDKYVLKKGMK